MAPNTLHRRPKVHATLLARHPAKHAPCAAWSVASILVVTSVEEVGPCHCLLPLHRDTHYYNRDIVRFTVRARFLLHSTVCPPNLDETREEALLALEA